MRPSKQTYKRTFKTDLQKKDRMLCCQTNLTRDLQKKTNNKDLKKHSDRSKETYAHQKRLTKVTYKRDLHMCRTYRSPILLMATLQNTATRPKKTSSIKSDLEKHCNMFGETCEHQKRPTQETSKRDQHWCCTCRSPILLMATLRNTAIPASGTCGT